MSHKLKTTIDEILASGQMTKEEILKTLSQRTGLGSLAGNEVLAEVKTYLSTK